MAGMSLADELAGAFDDPGDDLDGMGQSEGRSLADESGMDGGDGFGSDMAKGLAENSISTHYSHQVHNPWRWFFPLLCGSLAVPEEIYQVKAREEGQYAVISRFSSLGQQGTEGKDPMVLLEAHIADTHRLLERLKHLDTEDDTPRTAETGKANMRRSESVEEKLERHLDKVTTADRNRKDQLRKLGELEKEMDRLGFSPLPSHPVGHVSSGEPGIIFEEDEGEVECKLGWIELEAYRTPSLVQHPPTERDVFEPPDGLATWHDDSPPKAADAPRLPDLTKDLVHTQTHLALDLAQFGESLHTALSQHTSIARQLRGIRAAVESYREREAAEEAAHDAVEAWDRGRMERGLRGEESTEVTLRREIAVFQTRADECGRRMEEIMKALPSRLPAMLPG